MATTYPVIWYDDGTISVTNGDATITGSGTSWTTNVRRGDTIVIAGAVYVVGEVVSNGEIELTANYAGSTASGLSYTALRGVNWLTDVTVAMDVNTLLQRLAARGLVIVLESEDMDGDDPDSEVGGDSDIAVLEGPPHRVWIKAAGAWVEITAGLSRPPVVISNANRTILAADHDRLLVFALTTTNRTATLPEISAVWPGFRARVQIGATTSAELTLTRSGSDTFYDGATSKTITVAGGFVYVVAGPNGKWHVENIALAALAQGDPGPTGPQGDPGPGPFFFYKFSTSTTTTSDPGIGLLRFNHAMAASVTEIAIDSQTADSEAPFVANVIAALCASGPVPRAHIFIWNLTDKSAYRAYSVTDIITETGWRRLTVTHVANSGSFSANDDLSVQIQRVGQTGATGPARAMTGTSTTSVEIGTGSKGFTTQADIGWIVGTRVRVASSASPSDTWMEGIVTAYSGTSLTVNVLLTEGSGTLASWNISVAGARGATGATGATGPTGSTGPEGPMRPMVGTSTTSLTIGTGTKTFTTQAGIGWAAGATRIRAASDANPDNFMSGTITAYSDTTLEIDVDRIGGSGTFSDWTLSVTGDVGEKGDTGDQGEQGSAGQDGIGSGIQYVFGDETDATSIAAGDIRVDNADLTLATTVFVAKEDSAGGAQEAFLLSLADADNPIKGHLTLVEATTGATVTYEVTGVSDESPPADYVEIAVLNGAGISAFQDADVIGFQWARAGDKGEAGTDGLDGVDGSDPGYLLNWDDGTTDADPGSGNLRADAATLDLAGALFVSKTTRNGSSIESRLLELADSTSSVKGKLILTNTSDGKQASFTIVSVEDATGYVKVAIGDHDGEDSFADEAPISLQTTRTGDVGDVAGDASQIAATPYGELAGEDVQAQLEELEDFRAGLRGDVDGKADNYVGVDLKSNADYTVQASDHRKVVSFPLTTTNRTATLPSAATAGAGFTVTIKLRSTTTAHLTIARAGSDTFDDGGTSLRLSTAGDLVTLVSDGTSIWEVARRSIRPIRYFYTSSGTHTFTPGCRWFELILVGAGGGGGGIAGGAGQSSGGGGGGGAMFAARRRPTSMASATVTIGAGGAAGSTSGGDGGAGGDTIWSDGTNTFTAPGGGGGAGDDGSAPSVGKQPGNGGIPTGGDLNLRGQTGGLAVPGTNYAGQGGSPGYGLGVGSPVRAAVNAAGGEPGRGYGSGAAGTVRVAGSGTVNAGAGAPGVLIVIEHF